MLDKKITNKYQLHLQSNLASIKPYKLEPMKYISIELHTVNQLRPIFLFMNREQHRFRLLLRDTQLHLNAMKIQYLRN